MNLAGFPIISLILWLPALGAVLLLLVPRDQEGLQRWFALGVAVLTFLLALPLAYTFDWTTAQYQFVERLTWFPPEWGVSYSVAISGISLTLLLLTTFLGPIALGSTWGSIHKDFRTFQILMLLLETAMIGVFVAQDLVLFYIFFEFTLIPMALMIGIWGGPNRIAAAVKFFLYTFSGSIFMLLAIVGLYLIHGQTTGSYTADINTIEQNVLEQRMVFEPVIGRLLFAGFFLAFAIKTPLWPFHTWLPLAHVEAPTAGSIQLAAVLLKLGTYGFIRFNLGLFPEAARWAAPAIGVLAVISIIYGAIVSYAQNDAKRLIAYSSVSHMGFVVLGIFSLTQVGISGAVLQMINHGLSTGALFLGVGIIYEMRHTRDLAQFGGLWKVMPIYGGLMLVMVLSSVGLPGLNGFVGEYTIMQGAWNSSVIGWRYVLPSVIGVILAAAYLFKYYRLTFMGELNNPENEKLQDIGVTDTALLVALGVPIVLIGLVPNVLFGPMQPIVAQIVRGVSQAIAGQ